MRMKRCASPFFLVAVLLLSVLPFASGVYQLEYMIEVSSDGSATWSIQERFLKEEGEQPSAQLFEAFLNSIKALVNSAEEVTGREMKVDGFVMTVNASGSYTIVNYRFRWEDFAPVENDKVRIGDVFQVSNMFLYGDGIVHLAYAEGYIVESVSPQPHNLSSQILTWWGIADFGSGEPRIVLARKENSSDFWNRPIDVSVVVGLLVLSGVGIASVYYFAFKKHRQKENERLKLLRTEALENDEEKIANLLKASGGNLHQSVIARQCRFSKAKTSILLSKMENMGIIRRYEKGRRKIVMLVEQSEEAKEGES